MSSTYPCTCGTATCATDDICTYSSNQCEASFKSIHQGDVYFLYAGVPHQSIVACGYIEDEVREQECDSNSAKYWKDKNNGNIAPRIYISIGHKFEPYIKSSDVNPEGTGVNDLVPLGQQGSNKQIPLLASIRLQEMLNIELE